MPMKMQAKVGLLLDPMATPNSCRNIACAHKLHQADQELSGDSLVLPHVHGGLESMQALLKRYICIHASNVQGDRDGARRLGTATILLTDDIQHMSGVLQVRVKLLDLLLGMLVHPMTDTLGHRATGTNHRSERRNVLSNCPTILLYGS